MYSISRSLCLIGYSSEMCSPWKQPLWSRNISYYLITLEFAVHFPRGCLENIPRLVQFLKVSNHKNAEWLNRSKQLISVFPFFVDLGMSGFWKKKVFFLVKSLTTRSYSPPRYHMQPCQTACALNDMQRGDKKANEGRLVSLLVVYGSPWTYTSSVVGLRRGRGSLKNQR